jgi:ATP-dependent protease ClpP protease subunit
MKEIPQKTKPKVTYISFSAEITPQTTETLIAACSEQAKNRVETVYLLFSTAGDSVMHGIYLYNMLRAFPFELITHNVGNVESIGNAVFLAGSKRYACSNSIFKFHGVGWSVKGESRVEEKSLKEHLSSIKKDNERFSSIIRERTKLKAKNISNLFQKTWTKDVDFALRAGIIHEIREVNILPGNTILSLVFKR